MEKYLEALNKFKQTSPRLAQFLSENVQKMILPAGCVIEAKDYDDHIYFIEKGITAVVGVKQDKSAIKWFKKEGDFICNARSNPQIHLPHNLELITMQDSTWRVFSPTVTKYLFKHSIEFLWFFTRLLVDELTKIETHTRILRSPTLEAYYDHIKNDSPEFFERIPVKFLASYMRTTEAKIIEFLRRKGYPNLNTTRLKLVNSLFILGQSNNQKNNNSKRA